uniref:Uncharacterized protein n=1 Tax=Romanomermis culicivorax TaxID=13658 RepID=A0A915JWV7_ROMCU
MNKLEIEKNKLTLQKQSISENINWNRIQIEQNKNKHPANKETTPQTKAILWTLMPQVMLDRTGCNVKTHVKV